MASGTDCPLCDWHADPEPPGAWRRALAGILGVAHAVVRDEHGAGRDLEAHLSTHSLADWVRKVTELKDEVAMLRRELAP